MIYRWSHDPYMHQVAVILGSACHIPYQLSYDQWDLNPPILPERGSSPRGAFRREHFWQNESTNGLVAREQARL